MGSVQQRRRAIDIYALAARRFGYPAYDALSSAARQSPSDLIRLAAALASVANLSLAPASRFTARGVHLGINQPRTHAVDPDPLRRHLQRQPGSQGIYRLFDAA
jgi:hypothetical protein